MPRRKHRLILRSPSPGISLIPESTSPPLLPRIQRTRPIELPSISIVTNLNKRLASSLSALSSSTSSSCSTISQTQQQQQQLSSRSSSSPSSQWLASSSPVSPKSSKSSSPISPRLHYESCLYHLYDTTTTTTTTTTTNPSISGWDVLRASSDTSDTCSQNSYQNLSITPVSSPQRASSQSSQSLQSSPRQISSPSSPSLTRQYHSNSGTNTPSTSPHQCSTQSLQQYTSNTTSPSSSNSPISSPPKPLAAPKLPRNIRTRQTKHMVDSDQKYPKRRTQHSQYRHRTSNSIIGTKKYPTTTPAESDTSDEEIQHIDSGCRPAWMSRLRPRRHNNNNNNNSSNLVANNKKNDGNHTIKSNVAKPSTKQNNNRMKPNTIP